MMNRWKMLGATLILLLGASQQKTEASWFSFLNFSKYNRVNHIHDKENAQKIGSALTNLAAADAANSTVDAKLLANLDAVTGLTERSDNWQIQVDEQTLTANLATNTWLGLRKDLRSRLGGDTDGMTDSKILERIAERTEIVRTVGQVLKTLAHGQAARVEEGRGRLNRSISELQKATPDNVGANQPTWIEFWTQFQKDIAEAGRKFAENELARTTNSDSQRRLLDAIKKSRDPASAASLVAMIGSGLSDADFETLRNFLAFLQDQVIKSVEEKETKTSQKANISRAPGPRGNALSSLTIDNGPEGRFLNKLFVEPNRAPRPATLGPTNVVDQIRDTLEESIRSAYHLILTSLSSNGVKRMSSPFAKSLLNKASETAANGNLSLDLAGISTNLSQILSNNIALAELAGGELNAGRALLENTNFLSNLARNLSNANSTNTLGWLLQLGQSDPKLAELFNKKFPLDQKTIGLVQSIFSGIKAENQAASQRLLQFLIDITTAEVSLYQENARHYSAMGNISIKEMNRWEFVGKTYDKFREAYNNLDAAGLSDTSSLFYPPAQLNAKRAAYLNQLGNQFSYATTRGFNPTRWTNVLTFPVVLATTPILPTVRLLAENASAFQLGSPAELDPVGENASFSRNRLIVALKTVQMHTLLSGYNTRQALPLRRMLLREIKEHDIHLDGLIFATMAADIRLHVGDSQAFHASGWTQQDLQTFIEIIQSALVGSIVEGD